MFERVLNTLFSVENKWDTDPAETSLNKDLFSALMVERSIIPGTPTLTNAGRPEYAHAALSSCVVIPVNLKNKEAATKTIKNYYQQNMGSGYDFTPYENPVELLLWLNELSAQESATGQYDRYIGNMGNLHVSHPKIREFIHAKRNQKIRHFNISIDVTDDFVESAIQRKGFTLANGEIIDARDLLWEMAEAAHFNGDPGLINLERMNKDNPIAPISAYTSTPPCSEMGLAPGETCQFGYINLSQFVSEKEIDWEKLAQTTALMTRVLDNAIEVSILNYPDPESSRIAELKRKIGIGVCGLADACIKQRFPYDSEEARLMARDILSFINFKSKVASIELAEQRGPCEAMAYNADNAYYSGFIENRYANQPTRAISSADWQNLANYIKKTGHLRNLLTTALPPTGRASILLGVTSSIEPLFASSGWHEGTKQTIHNFVEKQVEGDFNDILEQAKHEGSFQNTTLPNKEVLKTAKEISFATQLAMIAGITGENGIYDESVSKTINMRENTTVEDVFEIFITAHLLGLRNISVYRDGSHINQPEKL